MNPSKFLIYFNVVTFSLLNYKISAHFSISKKLMIPSCSGALSKTALSFINSPMHGKTNHHKLNRILLFYYYNTTKLNTVNPIELKTCSCVSHKKLPKANAAESTVYLVYMGLGMILCHYPCCTKWLYHEDVYSPRA